MNKFQQLVTICEKVEAKADPCLINSVYGSRASRLIDLRLADEKFDLNIDGLLNADDIDFFHDVFGIWRESSRTIPCDFGMFVPRYARKGN